MNSCIDEFETHWLVCIQPFTLGQNMLWVALWDRSCFVAHRSPLTELFNLPLDSQTYLTTMHGSHVTLFSHFYRKNQTALKNASYSFNSFSVSIELQNHRRRTSILYLFSTIPASLSPSRLEHHTTQMKDLHNTKCKPAAMTWSWKPKTSNMNSPKLFSSPNKIVWPWEALSL